MNRPSSGRVLLVGEGDFSLSVALSNQLVNSSLVSSALLKDSEIQIHKQALENTDILKKKGVTVHLGVDATKLHEDERTKQHKFSRIIFNFPHIGGKSNIKRNRELLKNFFLSAAKCLAEQGEVCVTLCRGQGGTPADAPMRQWSDTWQVVAMAAYADMVLVETVPFVVEEYPEYSCTGYRSRDQLFHTKDAVTHVFKQTQPTWIPRDLISYGSVNFDDTKFWTNTYVSVGLEKLRNCLSLPSHPLSITTARVENAIREHCAGSRVEQITVPHVVQCDAAFSGPHYALHPVQPGKDFPEFSVATKRVEITNDPSRHKSLSPCENSSQTIRCSACTDNDSKKTSPEDACRLYAESSGTGCALRCSLMESLTHTYVVSQCDDDVLYTCVGDAYGRCEVSSEKTPQRYEMICFQKGCDSDFFQSKLVENFESVVSHQKKKLSSELYTEELLRDHDMLKDITTEMVVERVLFTDVNTASALNVPCNVAFDSKCGKRKWDGANKELSPTADIVKSRKVPFAFLGSFLKNPSVNLCVCSIDVLTQALFDVVDARLLWTDSLCATSPNPGRPCIVAPLTLHAPEWKHDVSFWLDSNVEFDEQLYMDVVRDHAGDCVRDVHVMNVWTPPGDTRTSRCYRHVYQPCDQAVSYHTAHEFQRLLRLKLAHVMKVELR